LIAPVRASLLLALAVALLSSPAFAQSTPLVLSVEASPERLPGTDSSLQPPGVVLISDMAANALDRKAAEIAAELGAVLPFDLLDEASRKLTVPEPLGGAAAQFVVLRDASGEAITKLLAERGWREVLHVRYIAVPDRRFWARLLVARITLGDEGPMIQNVATAYYITGFAKELRHTSDGWSPAALNVVESEIAASFAELSALWARVAEDAAGGVDPQTKWASLPGMPKDPDVWLRCKPAANCRDQHLLKLTESRAWITAGRGRWSRRSMGK
jgi:hypothetical protein